MAGKKQLSPVHVARTEGDPAPVSVSAATTRLEELRALRNVIAARIDHPETLARDIAALSRQLRDISKEIEEMDAVERERRADLKYVGGASDEVWRPEVV